MDNYSSNEMGDISENLHTLIYGNRKEENLSDLKPLDKYFNPKNEEDVSNFSLAKSGEFQVDNTYKKKSLKKKKKVS